MCQVRCDAGHAARWLPGATAVRVRALSSQVRRGRAVPRWTTCTARLVQGRIAVQLHGCSPCCTSSVTLHQRPHVCYVGGSFPGTTRPSVCRLPLAPTYHNATSVVLSAYLWYTYSTSGQPCPDTGKSIHL